MSILSTEENLLICSPGIQCECRQKGSAIYGRPVRGKHLRQGIAALVVLQQVGVEVIGSAHGETWVGSESFIRTRVSLTNTT